MRRLLYWLSARLPVRIICEEGRPYLERYYVGTMFGVRCYLHRFVGSDPDRGLHDHPWARAVSIILAGWYIEQRRDGEHRRRWVNWLAGDTFHRVVLPPHGGECWSLFFHGRRTKAWGFMRPVANDAALWEPHRYASAVSEEARWWLYAPRGRDESRRQPL